MKTLDIANAISSAEAEGGGVALVGRRVCRRGLIEIGGGGGLAVSFMAGENVLRAHGRELVEVLDCSGCTVLRFTYINGRRNEARRKKPREAAANNLERLRIF